MMKKLLAVLCAVLISLVTAACLPEAKPVEPKDDTVKTEQAAEHTVTVYRLPKDGTEKLHAEQVKVTGTKAQLHLLALKALIATQPQDEKLINAFPQGLKVLGLTVENGVAVVNLSKEIYNIEAGSYTEMMLTAAIANTLTEFADIKEVNFLIEGQKEATIKGHIDLLDAFERSTELIAK